MQPARGGGSGEGEGGASRAGLSRFRSAPATWLEALLEDEEEDPLKPNLCLTQLLTTAAAANNNNNNTTAHTSSRNNSSNIFGNITSPSSSSADLGGGGGGVSSSFEAAFPRQSSLPAGFPGVHDGFFSGFAVGAPTSFDLSPGPENLEAASSKRSRDLLSPIKLEQGAQGLIDMEMEKLLEESVLCRVRAKRGFATHPRSIAERVRRTRISDRIRKLQELVPNMDKQTNTADMLEEAVEYVKHLQKQIEELTENQRRCKCTNNEQLD